MLGVQRTGHGLGGYVKRTAAENLAQFASEIDFEDLPDAVVEKTRAHVLDSLGSQMIGALRRPSQLIRDYAIAESPKGPSTFVGVNQGGRPEWASLANGTCAHGFESDDVHPAGQIHPGAVTVPTALAVGEEVGASDKELLTAVALGFELSIRIGAAAHAGITHGRGIHPTSAVGPFGAAIVASKLRQLDSTRMTNALGVAGSHSSGTLEYTQTGGEVKRLHAGIANMAGVRAASLAARGLTAPRTILEGKRGFYQAFSDGVELDVLTTDLGKRWLMLDTAIKLYAASGLTHASLRAIHEMIAEDGLVAGEVESVLVGADRQTLWAVGNIGPHPRQMQEAQFSMHFSIALALAKGGNEYEHYVAAEKEGFDDAATRAIAEKVKLELDAQADAAFPEAFFSRVTVTRRNGQRLSRYVPAPGSAQDPLSFTQVREKFRRTSRVALDDGRLARMDAVIAGMPNAASWLDVMSILRAAGHAS